MKHTVHKSSVPTALNYQTPRFNNIYMKSARQNYVQLQYRLTPQQTENTGVWWCQYFEKQDLQHHWLIPDRFLKKNIRYNLHCNCKNMSGGMPLMFCALAVSSNYNNYPLSSMESNIHGQYFSFIVWTVQFTASIVLSNSLKLYVPTDTVRLRHCVSS
jgi:hypothetical protein